MIPCQVCGKDVGGGWVIGFPPAPDSQKMGLCRNHDAPGNREAVQRLWQDLIYHSLEESAKNAAYRSGDAVQLFSIYFTGGGAISIPCSFFCVLEEKTLKVVTPAGENIFFPLAQVRNYAISPLAAERRERREQKPLPE